MDRVTTGGDDGFPPRGSGVAGKLEALPAQSWLHPEELDARWDWSHGKLVLGTYKGKLIAEPDRIYPKPVRGDDRHIVTIAGSRAGKSSTVLIPNLNRYPGSVVVIDPKGELAQKTVETRAKKFGQTVAVLDPFGVSGWESATYNPLDELDPASDTFVDDVGLVADALIIDAEKDRHWTDAAKNFLRGLILYMFATGEASLPRLRKITLGEEGRIKARNKDPESEEEKTDGFLLDKMVGMDAFDGLVALIAQTMLDKSASEFNAILSVTREQISFLDSKPLAACLQSSAIRLHKIKKHPTSIYLVLPAMRLATHAKWLRVVLSLALVELERDDTELEYPVLLMLEEFAALGYLRPIEYATGFIAGFGVRLWPILQDLSQLKTHYPRSWETFLGNAGIVQAFGNADIATTEHLSKLFGSTNVVEIQRPFTSVNQLSQGDPGTRENLRQTRLVEPFELTRYFARETNRQLIFVPGSEPIYADRLPPEK
jgi:type IV secretion system protein VirD4